MKKSFPILLFLGATVAGGLLADEGLETPAKTVATLHEALAAAEKEKVLGVLDPAVTIFESGGAELSRDEYASHHLGADTSFSAATTRTIVEQTEVESGDAAWVLTRSETRGTFREQEVDMLGTETVLLRRREHGWRIVHIHWSSRSRSKEH